MYIVKKMRLSAIETWKMIQNVMIVVCGVSIGHGFRKMRFKARIVSKMGPPLAVNTERDYTLPIKYHTVSWRIRIFN
jgi:hypothetical protein